MRYLSRLYKSIGKKDIYQFLSYIIVGGTATLVEWGLFFWFVYTLKWNQNVAFSIAYVISTFVNMMMGRLITFRHARVIGNTTSRALNAAKETGLIYLIAGVGYVLNMLLLNFFTAVFHMDSMLAKIVVTGMMLIFNFLARKLGVYRGSYKPMPGTASDSEE
jgi:putative flippase GtrA